MVVPRTVARRRKLPAFFRSLLAALPFGEVYTASEGRAAGDMEPTGHVPDGLVQGHQTRRHDPRLVGLRLPTIAGGLLYFQSHHPKERHWYLQMLGTQPDSQGKGVGSAIIAPVLEHCDRTGERIYLESSKERNIPSTRGMASR